MSTKKNKVSRINFWTGLNGPFFALAPMADVTDAAFRQMFARHGKPDIMFTEFVSTDGLCSAGRTNLMRELKYSENERPIVAQLWGSRPVNFYKSAQLIADLGFDGIDINMGCPRDKEIKNGACAALINTPKLAREIIRSTKRGAAGLPVSVKTRIGLKTIDTEKWINELLGEDLAAITIHARTAKEMSGPPARWEEVARAVKLRDKKGVSTLIVGNGDIKSLADAQTRIAQSGADGAMVGRGVFGNPWFFNPQYYNNQMRVTRHSPPEADEGGFDESKYSMEISVKERLEAMLEHARLFRKLFGAARNFAVMRKHFKAYANGFPDARELRVKLMAAENYKETESAVNDFLKKIIRC